MTPSVLRQPQSFIHYLRTMRLAFINRIGATAYALFGAIHNMTYSFHLHQIEYCEKI